VPGRLGGFVISAATALVLLGVSILPFTTPAYVRAEQGRTGVAALTGFSEDELDHATGVILGDLFLWRGSFDVAVPRLGPVLNEREQVHMRDVRGVFLGFEVLIVAAVLVLAGAFGRARSPGARAAAWSAVGRGARGLAIALVISGAFAVFAFDAAFEVFHRLFFSGGTYTFDPRTDRLVQLFPEQFWSETAIAVGAVSIALAIGVALLAARRAATGRPARVLAASRARP